MNVNPKSTVNLENIFKIAINLKRRPDRLKEFINKCPFEYINVLYGFDGYNFDNEEDKSRLIQFFYYENNELVSHLNYGEIGCFLSHIRCYEYMIQNNIEYMLIFEDDCNFCDNFINDLNNILLQYNEITDFDNDILYIGGRFVPNFYTSSNCSIKINNNIIKHLNYKNYINYKADLDRTTHSYIISKNTAEVLLYFFNNNKIKKPIDHWLMDIFNNYNVNIYSSQPLLCYSPLISDSDIRQ